MIIKHTLILIALSSLTSIGKGETPSVQNTFFIQNRTDKNNTESYKLVDRNYSNYIKTAQFKSLKSKELRILMKEAQSLSLNLESFQDISNENNMHSSCNKILLTMSNGNPLNNNTVVNSFPNSQYQESTNVVDEGKKLIKLCSKLVSNDGSLNQLEEKLVSDFRLQVKNFRIAMNKLFPNSSLSSDGQNINPRPLVKSFNIKTLSGNDSYTPNPFAGMNPNSINLYDQQLNPPFFYGDDEVDSNK